MKNCERLCNGRAKQQSNTYPHRQIVPEKVAMSSSFCRLICIRPSLFGFAIILLVASSMPVLARQDPTALDGEGYIRMSEAREIALARSAAPSSVSADATIWLLRNGTFEPAIEGTNGNHCITMRSYPESIEPLCYDAEAARTILPLEIRRFELRNEGLTWPEIDARIEEDLSSGRLNVPERPAMSYMLSSAQDLYAPDGTHVAAWKPHIMLYMPGMTDADIGLVAGPSSFMQFAEPGTPIAHLIVVVPEFIDPEN